MVEICPHCRTAVVPTKERNCPHCRGGFDGALPPKPRVADGAIAKKCPNCGGESASKVKPDRWVSFAYDRACIECGTRYVLPTPVWAALLFMLLAMIFLLWGGVTLLAGPVRGAVPMVLGVLWLLIGLVCAKHGIAALLRAS